MHYFEFYVDMKAESVENITHIIEEEIIKSKIDNGLVFLFSVGSTSALSTIEYEDGLKKDIFIAMEKIAPKNQYYFHHETWHDDNGRSHVRSTIIGPSLFIPFKNKSLLLGTWQQVVLFNFDTRRRKRQVIGYILEYTQKKRLIKTLI